MQNKLNTLINGLKCYIDQFKKISNIENDIGYITKKDIPNHKQANWNQNDENADNYIKGRTHYDTRKIEVVDEFRLDVGSIDLSKCAFSGSSMDSGYYRLLDEPLSYEDLTHISSVIIKNEDSENTITDIQLNESSYAKFIECVNFYIVSVFEDSCNINGDDYLNKGLWIRFDLRNFYQVSTIIFKDYEIKTGELKKIDKKYLPNFSWDDIANLETVDVLVEDYTLYLESKTSTRRIYNNYNKKLEEGKTYTVIINNKEYKTTAWYYEYYDAVALGNGDLHSTGSGHISDEPFRIIQYNNNTIEFQASEAGTYNVSIYAENYITISEKYLPEYLMGQKLNRLNPSGEGSFSMNRKKDTVIGMSSHAEGDNTTASGMSSHAEGDNTTASSVSSHAEGGYTTASGRYSHAEGYFTEASGNYSHVQGKYNIEDTNNKYAHIVGNGNSDTKRSNAHTLDWDGNAWYQGTVECTGVILKASNGTKFKITVADDGTLSATQVTN